MLGGHCGNATQALAKKLLSSDQMLSSGSRWQEQLRLGVWKESVSKMRKPCFRNRVLKKESKRKPILASRPSALRGGKNQIKTNLADCYRGSKSALKQVFVPKETHIRLFRVATFFFSCGFSFATFLKWFRQKQGETEKVIYLACRPFSKDIENIYKNCGWAPERKIYPKWKGLVLESRKKNAS